MHKLGELDFVKEDQMVYLSRSYRIELRRTFVMRVHYSPIYS